jgi:hypothetical protein
MMYEVRLKRKKDVLYLINLVGKQTFKDIEFIEYLFKVIDGGKKKRDVNLKGWSGPDKKRSAVFVYCLMMDDKRISGLIEMIDDCDKVNMNNYDHKEYRNDIGEVFSQLEFGESVACSGRFDWCR